MANLFDRFSKKKAGENTTDTTETDATASPDTADAEAARGPKEGKRGLFGRVTGKKSATTNDDQLASVVDESEPGAVLERMSANTPFVLPASMGYVIPVLPTQDSSFGGLSKRQNKDSNKGNILNLINSDVINSVVTPDLLDDNALGFVPNERTLERMDEYRILREARYFYGVATDDPDTGDVFVYLVPPKRESSSDGKIFDEVRQVAEGRLVLDDVVDFDLIAAMNEIFQAEGADYGAEGVFEAMELNTEAIIEAKRKGTYPSAEQLIENLIAHFPEVLGDVDDEDDDVDADDAADAVAAAAAIDETRELPVVEDEDDVQDADNADLDADTPAASEVDVDAAEEPADEDVDATVSDEEDPFADFDPVEAGIVNPNDVSPEVSGSSVWQGEDVQSPFGEPDEDDDAQGAGAMSVMAGTPAQVLTPELAAQLEQVLQGAGAMSAEQFDTLMQAVTQSSDQLMERINDMEAEAEAREMERRGVYMPQEEGFDRDSINEGLLRRYDDSLDLHIDAAPFQAALGIAPRQIYEIQSDIETQWLRDQLNRIAVDLNTKIVSVNQANAEERRRVYMALVTALAKDITEQMAYDREDMPWYQLHKSIESDKEAAREQFITMVENRRKELREDYKQNRETYIQSRMAQAGDDFDRLNTPQHNAKLAAVESELLTMYQSFGDELDEKFVALRREEAKRRFNLGLNSIIKSMKEMVEAHDAEEARLFDEAHEVIEHYIDEHRADDIKQAAVWEDKLARDNRLQEAIADFEAREAKILADGEAEAQRFREQLESQRARFNEQMAERDQMASVAQENAQARIDEARADATRARDNAEARIAEFQAHMESSIDNAEKRALQAEANADAFIESERSERSVTIIILVVVALVMLLAGVGLGYFVL